MIDTISKATTDKDGNIFLHYALDGSVKYIIKVYCNSLTSYYELIAFPENKYIGRIDL